MTKSDKEFLAVKLKNKKETISDYTYSDSDFFDKSKNKLFKKDKKLNDKEIKENIAEKYTAEKNIVKNVKKNIEEC